MWRAFLVLGVLGGTAAAAPRAESMSFGAHSIIVPSKKLAYVMTESSKKPELVAVDLATGKRRWTSTAALKPIGVRGDSLVALDAAGTAMLLDARTGAKAKQCTSIAGVTAPFVDGLGVGQSASGYDDGKTLYLHWTRDTHYAGGAAPSPDEEARSRTHSEATWAIDVAACRAKKATLPSVAPVNLPATTDIVTASGKTARLERDAKTSSFTLIPASASKRIDLTEGDPARTQASLSVDRRHVACGAPVKNIAVFDLETGAVAHPAPFHLGLPWIYVGKTIIAGGGAVRALDAASGKVLWSVAERATGYDGPYPPSAAR